MSNHCNEHYILPEPPPLLYGIHDRPPLSEAVVLALQHVCAVFIPAVTPGLMITGALGLDVERTAYVLGMSLLMAGLGTILQVHRLGAVGSGLLAVQGTSFAFVTPILAVVSTALQAGETSEQVLSLIFGLCFWGAWVPIGLSRWLHWTRKIFTPLVTGTAVLLIGLSLIKVGMFQMAGGSKAQAVAAINGNHPLAFGSWQNWSLAFLAFAIVGICSASPLRYLRMSSVLIGLLTGSMIAGWMGWVDGSVMANLPIVNVPIPFRFGLSFDLSMFINFVIVYIVLTLEVAGDITATCLISGEPMAGAEFWQRLQGGILADGINSLLASIFGSFPIVTPAQNNGIIRLTGVASTYIGYFIAGILILMGLFPWVGGLLLTLPTALFGGVMMPVFGMVTVAGINILREVPMDDRTVAILAVSLALGLGVTFAPEPFQHFPIVLHSIFNSGVATGSLCALSLNLILPASATNGFSSPLTAPPIATERVPVKTETN